ncbi:Uncharacterized protein TCAP_02553 [Tolypocladium capitatum]|uniref:Uncharacterized protein n=1 Tax=Tolypocladium capitatum TaxID=45235 RepID=A0A2K3QIZ5_9HYPO|nr:Uncharacterized protein TCAP_02553 [Tolypocladium capitatum]
MAPPSQLDPRNSAPTSPHSPSSPSHVQQLPVFDTRFQAPSPYFCFHHIVDPVAATLEVQVLGPDLRFTFTHSRALEQGFSPSQVASSLERKTVGFVSLVRPAAADGRKETTTRVVLAWAESGHGAGRVGDILDAGGGALANALWTRRAMRMGALLGIKMDSPFDKMGAWGQTREDLRGVFLASHVEVKLAVHAVYVLLAAFKMPRRDRTIPRGVLRRLRHARWDDGSRPAFEIYFSRKNCATCGAFVRKLAALTGVDIRLVWRERLARVAYQKYRAFKGARADAAAPDCDGGDDDDEVRALDAVDLTAPSQPDVDLTRDTPEATKPEDGEAQDEAEGAEAEEDEDDEAVANEGAAAAVDAYIDGLAYCVGQSPPARAHATVAVVDLARRIRRQGRQRRVLSKPLPATPETEPPAWMAGRGVGERERRPYGGLVDGWLEG